MALNLAKLNLNKKSRRLGFGSLAKLPEETGYEKFKRDYLEREKRGLTESVWEWAKNIPDGLGQVASEYKDALTNESLMLGLFNITDPEDMKGAWKALARSSELGLRDEWNMLKVLQSSIRDYFNSDLSKEQRIRRAYARHKFETDYYNDARMHFIRKAGGDRYQEDVNVLGDLTTPTNLIPSLSGGKMMSGMTRKGLKKTARGFQYAGKGIEKVAEKAERVFSLPARGVEKVSPKGSMAYRGIQAFGVSAFGSDPLTTTLGAIGIGEIASKIARVTGREISEISRVFADPSSHARFLFKLSTDEAVSAKTRKLAARLYKMRGTRVYDILFDGMVAGLSSGVLQTAIEFAKGKSAEEVGLATGGGIGLGAPIGMAFGNRGGGKSEADRSDLGIKKYLENKSGKLDTDTIAALKNLDKDTLVALSTLDEFSDLGTTKMRLLDEESFVRVAVNNGAEFDRNFVPAAFHDPKSQTIFLNDKNIKQGVEAAKAVVLHEHGHAFMRDMMGSNPLMRRLILEEFEDKENGKEYFFADTDGNRLSSIFVNEEAVQFAKDYASMMGVKPEDFENSKYASDAYFLAEEIGAEQFSNLMREQPNVFKRYDKSFTHLLLESAKDALAKIGVVDPESGQKLDSPISATMLKNKGVQNAFNNYMQARNDHFRNRADDIETGRKHTPKKGQETSERFTELFGGIGVNLAVGGHFHLKDQTMFDQLLSAIELDRKSEDPDFVGLGKGFEGKRISDGIKAIFRGAGSNPDGAMRLLDELQLAIDKREQLKFGYRSAKWYERSGYNAFYERSLTPVGYQISPKRITTRNGRTVYPNLKIVGYDADIIFSNAQILKNAGFIKESLDDFFKNFEEHAQSVLQEVGEARINPTGKGENEMFVAVLGRIAGNKAEIKLQDPKLNEFFGSSDSGLKNAYKSYDVGGMAGASRMGKKGFAFNYFNAKHNYMPSLSGSGAREAKIPRTFYSPSAVNFMPSAPDTPEFKNWFGKSKVTDENGDPLVLYHGTAKQIPINIFEKQTVNGEQSPHIWNDLGLAFFTDDTRISDLYTFENNYERKQTGQVMPVFLKMENPKRISYEGLISAKFNTRGDIRKLYRDAKDRGNDGFIIDRGDGFDYVPFKSTQIKSAIGNRGTFDSGNPDIRFMPKFMYTPAEFTGENPKKQPNPFQKSFNIEKFEQGGLFFDLDTKENITNKTYSGMNISTLENKPDAKTADTTAQIPVGKPSEVGRNILVNMVNGRRGSTKFKWWKGKPKEGKIDDANWDQERQDAESWLVSIESQDLKGNGRKVPVGGKDTDHVFARELVSAVPTKLATYPKSKSNPRGRPTSKGEIIAGNVVGTMKMGQYNHYVYDKVTILPKGTANMMKGEPKDQDVEFQLPEIADASMPLFMPQLAMQNDPKVKYHYDTTSMLQPIVKPISTLSGERIASVLEADRHDGRGKRMAGVAHPFLKSNQITAIVDGVEWKPVWANMKFTFVSTQIGKQLNSTNGYNIIAIMDKYAHRSNRDVFTRMMKKIQNVSKKMTAEEKLITAQVINIFDIRYSKTKERRRKLEASMNKFIKSLGTAKGQLTRGNVDNFKELLQKAVKQVKNEDWWTEGYVKTKSSDFRKFTKEMTFNKRGAILKALEGLPWLPDIQRFLESEMDFEFAPTDRALAAVQLSMHKLDTDERVFAIYTGKDPMEERHMTDNEREVLKQLRANPNFREHPSYDWMMLGRADADNFYLDKPINMDTLIPNYRKDHRRFKRKEYREQLKVAQSFFENNPESRGFYFTGKGDKKDNKFISAMTETISKKAGISNVYSGKERLVVGAMKRNAKVPIIIP